MPECRGQLHASSDVTARRLVSLLDHAQSLGMIPLSERHEGIAWVRRAQPKARLVDEDT